MIALIIPCGYAQASKKNSCMRVYDRIVKPYQKLYRKLPKTTVVDHELPVNRLLVLRKPHCEKSSTVKAALKLVLKALSEHTARIGVLLPLSGPNAADGQAVLAGMKTLYPYRGIQFQDRVIVRDTRGFAQNMESALAEMIFKHQVSVVIGGLTAVEARPLARWASILKTPAVILNQKNSENKDPNIFYSYPSQYKLAKTLADFMKSKGVGKVALLRPANNNRSRFSIMLDGILSKLRINTENAYSYNPNDYPTLEAAAKKVFKIDPKERAEEYQALVREEKKKSLEAGLPFKPSSVALKPIIDIDAIVIDDNFRTVRHFAKLFRFLGVENIPLYGPPQWRARGLVDPPDPFLEGAYFVDYIGSYQSLPKGIAAQTIGSPFFVKPEQSSTIDYMIIGQHAVKISDRVLSKPLLKKRRLHLRLQILTNDSGPYFRPGRIFDEDQVTTWPNFIFQVGNKDISLVRSFQRQAKFKKPK